MRSAAYLIFAAALLLTAALFVFRSHAPGLGDHRTDIERECGTALPAELTGGAIVTDPNAVVIPMCDQLLFVPDKWMSSVGFDCPDYPIGRDRKLERVLRDRRVCPVTLITIRAAGDKATKSRGVDFSPDIAGRLPHFIGISAVRADDARGRKENENDLARSLTVAPDASIDADGYWRSGKDQWVLAKPTYARPGGIPLKLWCYDGLNFAKQVCRGYINYGSLYIVYDFVADDLPKASWEALDQNVLLLVKFMLRDKH